MTSRIAKFGRVLGGLIAVLSVVQVTQGQVNEPGSLSIRETPPVRHNVQSQTRRSTGGDGWIILNTSASPRASTRQPTRPRLDRQAQSNRMIVDAPRHLPTQPAGVNPQPGTALASRATDRPNSTEQPHGTSTPASRTVRNLASTNSIIPAIRPVSSQQSPQQASQKLTDSETQQPGAAVDSATDSVSEQETKSESALLADKVTQAIQEIEQSESLEDAEKQTQLEFLRKAQKWLTSADEYAKKTILYEKETKEAPQRLDEAKARLGETVADPVAELPADATLVQFEQHLDQAQAAFDAAQKDLTTQAKNADGTARADRKTEIAEQKEAAKQKLQEATDELKTAGSGEGSESMSLACQLELEARTHAMTRQIELLDAERTRSEALVELFSIQRDLAQRQVAWSQKLVDAWREAVTEFRRAESERQAQEARRIASEAHPAVRELAERNAELAESRTTLAREMETIAGQLEFAKTALSDLKEDYEEVQKKVEVAGMTPTIGLLLRNRRDHMPDIKKHRERITFSSTEMQRVQMALLELETERSEMGDMDKRIELALEELGQVAAQFEPGYLENMIRQLLQDRREYLEGLLTDYHSYSDDLSSLDLDTRELLKQVETYQDFIDERVLWIRSMDSVKLSDVSDSARALGFLVDPDQWGAALASAGRNGANHPLASAALIMACIASFVFRHRIRVVLDKLGNQANDETPAKLLPTVEALLLTVPLAAVWPLLFWGMGWWLALNENSPELALGLAKGLKSIAVIYFVADMFRQICRPGGLAEIHFGWHVAWMQVLYRGLNRLMLLGLPTVVLVSVIQTLDDGEWQNSLGRFAVLLGLLFLTVFLHQVLRPSKGAFQAALQRTEYHRLARFRHIWYVLGVGFPVTLMVLVSLGYMYSVEELMHRLQDTVFLVLAIVLGQALLAKALTVTRDRLASLRATATHLDDVPEGAESSDLLHAEQNDVHVRNIDRQLRQLIQGAAAVTFVVAACLIWSDMFPALQALDREMWSTTRMVSEVVHSADGASSSELVPKTVPVTLADLLIVAVILAGTFVSAKTVPGLLEVAVLSRLPIDVGARYATVILSRYAVTLLGTVVAFRMLGMTWASVQWLAAAMTVGLGFGMQEIFANLVSGLIILFERPVRIGDLVTVNGTTGRVTRMRIRSTTITDFDRRELIVPNKRFITDDVVNWTLSDPITRFVIPVGIAYGCDPSAAHKLLLQIATEHPLILDEPGPSAVFVGFGDSTLNLELRAFLGSRDHFGTALHELNLAIDRTFRDAGIEIAFPQQDIYIRDINVRGLQTLMTAATDLQPESIQRKAA